MNCSFWSWWNEKGEGVSAEGYKLQIKRDESSVIWKENTPTDAKSWLIMGLCRLLSHPCILMRLQWEMVCLSCEVERTTFLSGGAEFLIQRWCRGAPEWEQSLGSCDTIQATHYRPSLWFSGGREQKTATSFLGLSPIPSPSSLTLQAQKSPRNGSDITDTISGTPPGKDAEKKKKEPSE